MLFGLRPVREQKDCVWVCVCMLVCEILHVCRNLCVHVCRRHYHALVTTEIMGDVAYAFGCASLSLR
jgi:hypothetical protein